MIGGIFNAFPTEKKLIYYYINSIILIGYEEMTIKQCQIQFAYTGSLQSE